MSANCSNCRLHGCKFTASGLSEGPDVLVILESPDDIESLNNRPYTGRYSSIISDVLKQLAPQVNLPNMRVEYTYLVGCYSPNRTQSEVDACLPRVYEEIDAIKPKHIIGLGAKVSEALFPTEKFAAIRGRRLTLRGFPCLITYSPGVFVHKPELFQTFVDQVGTSLLEAKYNWDSIDYTRLETDADVIGCITAFNHSEENYLDIETCLSMKPMEGRVVVVGFQINGKRYIITGDLFGKHAKLIDGSRQVIVHGAHYEIPWMLYHYGIKFTNVDDTLQMYHLCDERTSYTADNSKSLKTLGERLCDCPSWADPVKPYIKGKMHLCPPDTRDKYLAYDIGVGKAVYDELKEMLKQQGMEHTYYNVVRPQINFVHLMTAHGIKVDYDYHEELGNSLKQIVAEQKEKLRQICDMPRLNPNSTQKELPQALFGKLGLPNIAKGSTNKTVLTELQILTNHPVIDVLLEYRSNAKLLSTYVEGLEDFLCMDGRVHPKFNLDGAATGRTSVNDPALQTIPSHRGPLIKRMFLPDEGMVAFDADYSQLELVVGAHIYQDPVLIEFINAGLDMHKEMASVIWGIPIDQVTDQQRTVAKKGNFGVMYQMDKRGAMYNIRPDYPDMTWELAEKIVKFPRDKFKVMYLKALEAIARDYARHYSETIFGRRRRYPLITEANHDTVVRQISNHPIQGTASDICLMSAMRLQEKYPELRVQMTVHDSIVGSMPSDFDPKKIIEVMTDMPFETNVKFRAEVKVGKNWGDMVKCR